MLRMVIADDEFIVRDSLRTVIPWDKMGIEVVGEAEDGQETLDLCKNLNPDILLTDIRMPFYSGLEVANMLKQQGIKTRTIIISGVQDFSYAKTALTVSAAAYILKPVKIDELTEAVNRVAAEISKEKENEERLHKIKNQLKENASVLREKFLRTLIYGVFIEDKDLWENVNNFSIPFVKNEKLQVAILEIDDYSTVVENYKKEYGQLLTFSVFNIIEEVMSSTQAGVCFINDENEFILIFSGNALSGNGYKTYCNEIIASLNKTLNVSASIGIGSPKDSPMDISDSYNEAAMALQYRFFAGKNTITDISEVDVNKETCEYPNLHDAENQLIDFLKRGESKSVSETISNIFSYFEIGKKPSVEYVKRVCIELVSIISRVLYEMGENMDNIVETRSVIFEAVSGMQEFSALKEYITDLFIKISDYFLSRYTQKNAKIINKIKEIIKRQYNKDLSVTDIANEVYLSPNYISLIFKQETGITITEYITNVRMEAAKELLSTTDFKIFEIAEMVGYENPHYFSTVFKKSTGIHPQNFRNLKNEGV